MVEGVARGVLDRSDVNEELHRVMWFELGFSTVGWHVGERAIWHCLGFLHVLEGVDVESRVHFAEVDGQNLWYGYKQWALVLSMGPS